jgi:hypothetical protein
MKVWLLRDLLMPFNTEDSSDSILGLYSTYEGAWRAGKQWLNRHRGFTWEDLEIEVWGVEE